MPLIPFLILFAIHNPNKILTLPKINVVDKKSEYELLFVFDKMCIIKITDKEKTKARLNLFFNYLYSSNRKLFIGF